MSRSPRVDIEAAEVAQADHKLAEVSHISLDQRLLPKVLSIGFGCRYYGYFIFHALV